MKASLTDSPMLIEMASKGHSIVDLEILPGGSLKDLSPKAVYLRLQEQLKDNDSSLLKGHLKAKLKGAKLSVGPGVEGVFPHSDIDDSGSVSLARQGLAVIVPIMSLLFAAQ